MKQYQPMIVYAPFDDVSREDWENKVNGKHFDCGSTQAIEQIKEFCPNIESGSIKWLCDNLNEFDFPCDLIGYNYFGVIYIEI